MKPVVLITGANGMLAKSLENELEDSFTIKFLTRKVKKNNEYLWDIQNNFIDPKALNGVNHIIHLAGSSIAKKRWTPKRKKELISSRIESSNLILKQLIKNQITIESFISASAIGYYGSTTSNETYTEESPNGFDFLGKLCAQWEGTANSFKFEKVAKRVLIVRIGLILAKDNGVLSKLIRPINIGLGSPLGSGNQWMPWIHIQDLNRIFKFLIINKEINGVFNAVSPNSVSNNEMTREIAKTLNRKITLPNIPKFIIKLVFGEMSVILLEGNRVSAQKIIDKKFKFEYEDLNIALHNLLDK